MSIFRKKEDKKKISKKLVIILEIIGTLILISCLIGIKYFSSNKKENNDIIKLDNQIVSDITFSDFKITYDKEKNNAEVTVNAINYTDYDKDLKTIHLKLYSKDNNLVSQIDFATEGKLSSGSEILINGTIGTDVMISKVEYIVE